MILVAAAGTLAFPGWGRLCAGAAHQESPAGRAAPRGDAPGAKRAIVELIPADCAVAYMARPYFGGATSGQDEPPGKQLAAILTILNAGGLIPDEGQVYADIAARLPLLGRYEHAVALLDVSSRVLREPAKPAASRPGGGATTAQPGAERVSLRLERLRVAVILRTGGDNRDAIAHMNHVLGRYTNEDVADVTRGRAGAYEYERLKDDRLTGWAVCEWGAVGDFFVVCFGEGTFERIADAASGKRPALSADAWYQKAAQATRGTAAQAQWYLGFARLEECLQPVAGERYGKVRAALHATGMTRDLWTVGREGRATTWLRYYRRNSEDVLRVYSDPESAPERLRRIIPAEAKNYAIIKVPTRWLVDNLPKAWLAAQSEVHVQRVNEVWDRLERQTGIDIGGSLIKHLGEHVVIFDYPRHPLEVPFALTVGIEIDDAKAVETALDALLSAWGKYLDQRAERRSSALLRMYVKKDKDGVWYLQAGILGPALKVTERFIVISWSPHALREALGRFEK